MRLQTLVSATIMATATLTSPALADKAILVLDGSGSMWGQIEGENKIVIARETVGTLMADWPASTELGLIAYGHREKGNCGDIETLVPVGSGTASAVDAAVGTLNPKGKTPITAAVHQAAAELRSTEEKATVILVSDGLETCNADPCAAAAELEANGIDFTVHVIGFGTTPEENQQLQCLADNTGGKFLGAANASELKTAMAEVKEVVVKVQKIKAATGSLQLVNNNLHQRVYDENGKQAAAGVFKKAEQLPPGRYAMRYGKITIIENFEINAGEELVIDLADHIGWFQLVNSSSQQYLYDESGKKISGGLFRNAVQLPPGRYSMKSGNVTTVEDFEIKAGEKLMIDLDDQASLDEPSQGLSQSKSNEPARSNHLGKTNKSDDDQGQFVLGQELADARDSERKHQLNRVSGTSPMPADKYDVWRGDYDLFDLKPLPLDAKIREICRVFREASTQKQRAMRDAMSMDDFYTLLNFGKRASVQAIRSEDVSIADDGHTAMAMIDLARIDYRDALMSLGLLRYALLRLGANADESIEQASHFATPEMAELLLSRTKTSTGKGELSAWGYKEFESSRGIGFVSHGFDPYAPQSDLFSVATDIAAAINDDSYRADVELAQSMPSVWLEGHDDTAIADALASVTGGVIIRGQLLPDKAPNHRDQQLTVFIMETGREEFAGKLLAVSRLPAIRPKHFRLGAASGTLFALMVARTHQGDAFESAESLNRFEPSLQRALDRHDY